MKWGPLKWDPIEDIQNIAGDVGDAVSSGAKSVGGFLKDASPVLLPLLATTLLPALMPSLGLSGWAGSATGLGGTIGKALSGIAGATGLSGILGGGSGSSGVSSLIGKMAPNLIAKAINKPKSQTDYAMELQGMAPGLSPSVTGLSESMAGLLGDAAKNPKTFSTPSIQPLTAGTVSPRSPVPSAGSMIRAGTPDQTGGIIAPVAPLADNEELRRLMQRDRRLR